MIYWDVSPEIFSVGFLSVRWYGLLFATSFILGFQIMTWIYRKEKKSVDDLNDLIWYMILGTVIGARLGHCLFYNPGYYLSNPLEILQIWKGGLASHGAAIGILYALYLYSKKKKDQPYLWVFDRIVITVALGGFFIRTGNLFNSEIIGVPTDLPWGFIFARIDDIPRHPAQLYEALAYLLIFVVLITVYYKKEGRFRDGYLFGIFLVLVFAFRFIIEFVKENQVSFEEGLILNMGQILSVPLIALGIYLIVRAHKKSD